MSRALRCAVLFAVLQSPAPAQTTTWIVDENSGPGTHFTDIPPAIDAAADGDTIVVRTGSYAGFATGKALAILGEPPVIVGPWRVTGLGAGKTFVAKNLDADDFAVFPVLPGSYTAGIALGDNAGRIHLEDVRASLDPLIGLDAPALSIDDCVEVTVTGGELDASPGVAIQSSTVALSSVRVVGRDTWLAHTVCRAGGPGMTVDGGSTVYLSRTTIRGGTGATRPFFGICPPGAALVIRGGVVTVTGDGATTLTAGLHAGTPTPAILLTGGRLELDSGVTLAPTSGGQPLVVAAGAVTTGRFVSLTASGAPPGGNVGAEVVSPAGDPGLVLLSAPADPTSTAFGVTFLDLTRLLALPPFVQGASERFSFAVPVPSIAVLSGQPIALQVANLSAASGTASFSNPAVVVLW